MSDPNDVRIDNRPATDAEAEELRNFVRENCRDQGSHAKPIRHLSWDFAWRKLGENGYV